MPTYEIVSGPTHQLSDTRHFLQSLDLLPELQRLSWNDFLGRPDEIIITRAPGRLDVMGGIADYSGSLVLQLPIANSAHVALQRTETNRIRLVSLAERPGSDDRCFEMSLKEFLSNERPIEYAKARERFAAETERWAAYVAGAFIVLMREKEIDFGFGVDILIRSSVPEGKGVSSSAALEVAAMQAIVTAFDIDVSPTEVALLCQKVENLVAGAPCGIMDQMTSACGEEGRLLELVCQPCNLKGTVHIPDELKLWGLDSGVRHSVSGSDYGTVRTAAFMGYRIIAEKAGLEVTPIDRARVSIADPKWNGYLANLTPQEFEDQYKTSLPDFINGEDFLKTFGGITDDVTSVKPDVEYPVRQATQHPIYENSRVQAFARFLKHGHAVQEPTRLGEMMFQSHQSYSDCGLGSERTDLLVKLVRELSAEGLFGARITGGGSGGTIAVLGHREATDAIAKVVERFEATTGYKPLVISGSSPGASAFDHLRLRKEPSAG